MSLNDIFKSFFGFKDPFKGGNSSEGFHDFGEGESYEDFDEGQHGEFDDVFKHFHESMFSQMEELFRQMDDMFHHSGKTDFPPGLEGPHQRPPENPRDHMLKEPDNHEGPNHGLQTPRIIVPRRDPGFSHPPSFFGTFSSPRWKRPDVKDRQDKDLDGETKIDDIVDLFKNPQPSVPSDTPSGHYRHSPWGGPGHIPSFSPEQSPWPGGSRKSSSWSFSWSSNGNMKSEERKTLRDSSGNEETTVTRSIGDQSHSVTTKRNNSGSEEKIENFQNMDSDDLSKFNEKWNSRSGVYTQDPRDRMLCPPPTNKDKNENKSFFQKWFGW